ncbi:MAG: DUF4169 family protein [Hyphomicrobiales bacterium]
MGEVINLNRFKKQKARAAREDEAAANRAKFGRTKAEKQYAAAEAKREEKSLDGHKREE